MSEPAEAFVLLVCDDLFFGSRISGAAQRAGVSLVVDSAATLARISEPNCVGLVLDMNHAGTTPNSIAQAAPDGLRLVAFGPHVRTELFEAATDAGFETLTRGQLDRAPHELLGSFATG